MVKMIRRWKDRLRRWNNCAPSAPVRMQTRWGSQMIGIDVRSELSAAELAALGGLAHPVPKWQKIRYACTTVSWWWTTSWWRGFEIALDHIQVTWDRTKRNWLVRHRFWVWMALNAVWINGLILVPLVGPNVLIGEAYGLGMMLGYAWILGGDPPRAPGDRVPWAVTTAITALIWPVTVPISVMEDGRKHGLVWWPRPQEVQNRWAGSSDGAGCAALDVTKSMDGGRTWKAAVREADSMEVDKAVKALAGLSVACHVMGKSCDALMAEVYRVTASFAAMRASAPVAASAGAAIRYAILSHANVGGTMPSLTTIMSKEQAVAELPVVQPDDVELREEIVRGWRTYRYIDNVLSGQYGAEWPGPEFEAVCGETRSGGQYSASTTERCRQHLANKHLSVQAHEPNPGCGIYSYKLAPEGAGTRLPGQYCLLAGLGAPGPSVTGVSVEPQFFASCLSYGLIIVGDHGYRAEACMMERLFVIMPRPCPKGHAFMLWGNQIVCEGTKLLDVALAPVETLKAELEIRYKVPVDVMTESAFIVGLDGGELWDK